VAIPAISSGIFGFPKPMCAEIMFDCFEQFQAEGLSILKDIGQMEEG